MGHFKASEQVAVLAVIDPDAYAAATAGVTSDWASFEYFEEMMAIVMAGTFGTSGTLDAALLQATSATGAGSKAITGKSITQLTDGATDDDLQAIINLRADELDVANNFRFAALKMTTATATGDSGGLIIGLKPKHGPASGHDLASVTEIV